jgi:hypothetical protein
VQESTVRPIAAVCKECDFMVMVNSIARVLGWATGDTVGEISFVSVTSFGQRVVRYL